MSYLQFYLEYVETGSMGDDDFGYSGLCDKYGEDELFQLFRPDNIEKLESNVTWASGNGIV